MNRRLGVPALVLAALLSVTPLAAAAAARAATSPALTHLADFLPRLNLASDLGLAPSSTSMSIVVSLAHPDMAAENAAYTAMYNPSSPDYHRFLTPTQYDAAFGVAPSVVAATTAWLRSKGLTIDSVSGAGDIISAHATARTVAHAFGTTIHSYRYQGSNFLANTGAISIPAALPITTVLGLNTLQQFHTTYDPVALNASKLQMQASGGTFDGTFTAKNLWKIYDMPSTNTGQGQSIAIFGEGDAAPEVANLRVFEEREGLPEVPVRVVHTQVGYDGDISGEGEFNLDGQAATGMAPGAKQLVYYFSDALSDSGVAASFAAWANDPNGPMQANASFGECETDPLNPLVGSSLLDLPDGAWGQGLGDNQEVADEPVLRQATMEGRTLFTSTGDTAALCPAVVLPVVGPVNGTLPGTAPWQSYPAVSHFVVSVGGTVLTSNAAKTQRVSETAWTYGGGGSSLFMSQPAFQQGIGAINTPCLVSPDAALYPVGTLCRGVPDIADISGGGIPQVSATSAYDAVEDMVDSGVRGTSLASPTAAGMWARIEAAAPAGGLGFADESFYRLAKGPTYHRDFYDVTASEFGLGNILHQPTTGWDYTTGLGVMDVTHLMQDLDHRLTPTNPAAAPAVAPNALACPVITSPANNGTDPVTEANTPEVDFTRGGFAVSPDHKTLQVSLYGVDLSPGLVVGSIAGTGFMVYWTVKGKTYFAQAQASIAGISYSVGHVDAVNGPVVDDSVVGTFANGLLTIDVPLKDVGNPAMGTRFQFPYGATQTTVAGVPGVVSVLAVVTDAGSTNDYLLGKNCPASGA